MSTLDTLKRTGEYEKTRVGRGGRRGKTSGRGTKGQSARAGNKKRPEMRDLIKKLPKRRGYGKNRSHTVNNTKPADLALSIARLDKVFAAGDTISRDSLIERGLLKGRGLQRPSAKIVSGTITKKFDFVGLKVTTAAKVAIEAAGGSVVA